MRVDARPFFPFVSPNGASALASRPEFNPQTVGFGRGGQTGVVQDTATHRVTVYNPVPADVTENAQVTVDGQAYRVVRGGIDRQRYGAILYLRLVNTTQELP